ncbi:hypothetical protein QBC47DRAFT_362856 [Echria macrotheca]|uniref:F-box domain-containing protein n=1 Tax=Echria macrotheca TaxID=438768 RepID=A0AAJ0F9D3_9PEZI|nr:hypothetical protein QBC47DRAFT_362856 [Echria macrotheca]
MLPSTTLCIRTSPQSHQKAIILRLPDELLLQIIGRILLVPGWSTLTTSRSDLEFLDGSWYAAKVERRRVFADYIKQAFVLSQVCRHLHHLTAPLLYANIFAFMDPPDIDASLKLPHGKLELLYSSLSRHPWLRQHCRSLYLEVCAEPDQFEIARDLATWLTETKTLYLGYCGLHTSSNPDNWCKWPTQSHSDININKRLWDIFSIAADCMPNLERITFGDIWAEPRYHVAIAPRPHFLCFYCAPLLWSVDTIPKLDLAPRLCHKPASTATSIHIAAFYGTMEDLRLYMRIPARLQHFSVGLFAPNFGLNHQQYQVPTWDASAFFSALSPHRSTIETLKLEDVVNVCPSLVVNLTGVGLSGFTQLMRLEIPIHQFPTMKKRSVDYPQQKDMYTSATYMYTIQYQSNLETGKTPAFLVWNL